MKKATESYTATVNISSLLAFIFSQPNKKMSSSVASVAFRGLTDD